MKPNHNIGAALNIFYKWAKRGMIIGQIKEKWGDTRWYAHLTYDFSLNDIFYPMHYYYRLPKWCRFIDYYFLTPVFGKLIGKWRVYCYRQAYLECAKKFGPLDHCMDHEEVFTDEELKRITILRWEPIS
jgi:hypothetical protein